MESVIYDQTRKGNPNICEREKRKSPNISYVYKKREQKNESKIPSAERKNNIQHKEKKENKRCSGIRDIYHYLTRRFVTIRVINHLAWFSEKCDCIHLLVKCTPMHLLLFCAYAQQLMILQMTCIFVHVIYCFGIYLAN